MGLMGPYAVVIMIAVSVIGSSYAATIGRVSHLPVCYESVFAIYTTISG